MSSSVTVSAVSDTVTPGVPGASGASISSSEYGPWLASVRVALIRTVYVVPLVRPEIVWLAVEPEPITACRPLLL